MMKNYTVKEWQCLHHGYGDGKIPPRFAEKLVAAQNESKEFAGKVLEERRGELWAQGVVGILSVPECSMEILPKIDVGREEGSSGESGKIRKRLVHMLSVALNMRFDTGLAAQIDWQRYTLLEFLIQEFLVKLLEAVRRGMPHRYVHCEDDLRALRGALDATRQFTQHAANPARLACRFDELSDDIALNRVMKATVAQLLNISRDSKNLRHLRKLAFDYADITHIPTASLARGEVVFDRTNRAWEELYKRARLILGHRYQSTNLGKGKGIGTSILFEMNKLFEKYVDQIIKRALADTNHQVFTQGEKGEIRNCLTSMYDGREDFENKPDILIRRGDRVALVIDTKWKEISISPEGRIMGLLKEDVYQMMRYAQVYEARRVMLLYPHHDGLPVIGIQEQFQINGHGGAILDIASVNVAVGSKKTQSQLHDMIRAALDGPGNTSTESDAPLA